MGEQATYEQLQAQAPNAPTGTAIAIRHRIKQLLKSRRAPHGTRAARVENSVKTAGLHAWNVLEKRPVVGSLLVSGVGLGAALAIGGSELTLAILLGYSAYQVLRERQPPKEAAQHMLGNLKAST